MYFFDFSMVEIRTPIFRNIFINSIVKHRHNLELESGFFVETCQRVSILAVTFFSIDLEQRNLNESPDFFLIREAATL